MRGSASVRSDAETEPEVGAPEREPRGFRRRLRGANALHRYGPLALVAITIVFNLVVLRAEATPVGNLNDGSVHRSMIQWAEDRWTSGHLPFDGWYPEVGLGSSRFHHYQSLPHILMGLVAIVIGSPRAYSYSLYLLMALWPISVYWGGRLFGLGRWRSACAAMVSPLIVSAPTLGYEWGSYAWRGYGTWTQAWGMWLLPVSWGLGFRAISRGRSYAWAALAIAMTVAVHLLTGYLALLSLGVFVLLRPTKIVRRIGRAAIVAVASLAISAFMLVPLLLDRAYEIQDEFSRGKVYYDSFGATQIMKWMVSGEIFDRDRIPVLTALAGLGLLVCLWRWRRDERARGLVGVALLSLALFFGRSTWGVWLKLLPGSGDLFLRRYVFGVHLAGLYLIGYAMATIGRSVLAFVRRHRPSFRPAVAAAVLSAVAIVVLSPAWLERSSWAALGAKWIHEQQAFDATDGANVAALVSLAESRGPGRIYGGMRSNWGATYRVGQVPVYAVLTNLDVMQLGFTRPTWSLATPAEYRFRDFDPSAYDTFDVRYVIEPDDRAPPTQGATEVAARGRHVLYEMPDDGAVDVYDVGAPLQADRTDLGVTIAPWLTSNLPGEHITRGITYAAFPAAPPTISSGEVPGTEAGSVTWLDDDIANGVVSARVDLVRSAAVVLKQSFDNRWTVTVDGREVPPQMFTPGFVGREVPPGQHEIVFRYVPFPRYDVLILVGAGSFLALWGWEARRRRGRPGRPSEDVPAEDVRAA